MEASPLVAVGAPTDVRSSQAHSHAAQADRAQSPDEALLEHGRAAQCFREAQKLTSSAEALRVLAQLEVHHRQRIRIIERTKRCLPLPDKARAVSLDAPKRAPDQQRRQKEPRLATLAGSLASARGIPASKQHSRLTPVPLLDGSNARGSIVKPSLHGNKDVSEAAQRTSKDSQGQGANFARFYASLGDVLNTISAPLAFAGLPLKEVESGVGQSAHGPPFSRIFSPAALRALQEDPDLRHQGPAESFYVVPKAGGSLSYASVLARSTIDARRVSRFSQAVPNGKTHEEIQLENTSLRSLVDDLSHRLWQFEISSQMNRANLDQSIRATGLAARSAAVPTVSLSEVRLEEKAAADVEVELAALRRENERLTNVLEKYRERWEYLKGSRRKQDG